MYWQSEKVVKQHILHISSLCGELRPTNGWDRFFSLGQPSKFQRVSCLGFGLRHCTSDVAQQRSTKLCTIFCRLLGWYITYTFSGALAPDGILPNAKFALRPSLVFSYIAGVNARHLSSRRQPNCWFQQRAPPVFCRAAITWFICLHSTFFLFLTSHFAPIPHRWNDFEGQYVNDVFPHNEVTFGSRCGRFQFRGSNPPETRFGSLNRRFQA